MKTKWTSQEGANWIVVWVGIVAGLVSGWMLIAGILADNLFRTLWWLVLFLVNLRSTIRLYRKAKAEESQDNRAD